MSWHVPELLYRRLMVLLDSVIDTGGALADEADTQADALEALPAPVEEEEAA